MGGGGGSRGGKKTLEETEWHIEVLEIINAETGRNEVLPNISQPMLVEKTVLELPQFEGENLVNI